MKSIRCRGTTCRGKQCKLKSENNYCKIHKHQKDIICSICIEPIRNKIKLDCEHTFCKKCLFEWMFTKRSCPLCRCRILNSSIREQFITHGIRRKIFIRLTACHINISSLPETEQDVLSFFGIFPNYFMIEQDWEVAKQTIDFLEELSVIRKNIIMRVEDDFTYSHLKDNKTVYLFD